MGTPMPVRGAKPSKHTSNTRLSNFNITRRTKFHRNKKQKKCDLLCLFLGCYFAFTYDEAQRINCINCSKTRNMQYFSFRIKALSLFEAITSDVSRQTVLFPFFFPGHHLQTIVTHNIWRPRRVSYPRWRLRWQERWWLTGPRPPWWPDSFGDETSSSARSGRGSVGEERDARCLTQTLHDKGGGGG